MKSRFFIFSALSFLTLASCVPAKGNAIVSEEATHIVTFDSNGGSPVESQKVVHGEKATKPNDPVKEGYSLVNWTFNGEEWSFIGYSVTQDMTLVANWSANAYTLTLVNDDEIAGSIDGGGEYEYDSEVTINATANTGYSFVGWYDENNRLVSDQSNYTFVMGLDKTLYAKWSANTYTITLILNDGSSSETKVDIKYGFEYTLPTPNRPGYTFNGWHDDQTLFASTGIWNYASDKTLIAQWTIITYQITYILNGGDNNINNPETYTVEDEIILYDPIKTGYSFNGWYDGEGNEVHSISSGNTGDITLFASWSANLNVLSVTSDDELKGTVEILSGSGFSDETIVVKATPKTDCVFIGWYNDSSFVSANETYSFIMPEYNYSLVGHFMTQEEKDESLGIKPVFSSDGKTFTYGMYPQTNINDPSVVSTLTDMYKEGNKGINGWYLFNNNYYARLQASPNPSAHFDNGDAITNRSIYWFKCEPIRWNILRNNNNEYYVVSSLILDNCAFYSFPNSDRTVDGQTIYNNNYKHSEIRSWLLYTFHKIAFALGKEHILITMVDNSAATTEYAENRYACADTSDNVFLPSYQDYVNSSYGFLDSRSSTRTRQCKTTDWARAKGILYETSGSNLNFGYYWTRSPYSSSRYDAWIVGCDGSLTNEDVFYNYPGVRPAITLKID